MFEKKIGKAGRPNQPSTTENINILGYVNSMCGLSGYIKVAIEIFLEGVSETVSERVSNYVFAGGL
jgi:hypothetical protein